MEAAVANGRAAEVLDLRLGPYVERRVAVSLAELAARRPELLREARPRFPELLAALVTADWDDSVEFFDALRLVGEGSVVTAYALDLGGDVDTRMAAIAALVANTSTSSGGRDLARRIATNRGERATTRIEAMRRMDSCDEAQRETVRAEVRRHLTELLADEENVRVRTAIEHRLAED